MGHFEPPGAAVVDYPRKTIDLTITIKKICSAKDILNTQKRAS